MTDQPLSAVFYEIAELHGRLGVEPLAKHEGCWTHRVDDTWWIAVNGHKEEVKCKDGVSVPPFHAYIECAGGPAGLVNPYGGMLAGTAYGREDDLIDALRRAGT